MRVKYLFFAVLLLLVSCEQEAQDFSDSEYSTFLPDLQTLPLNLGEDNIKSLRTLIDPSFQADLEGVIKANQKWNRLISQKKMAVGLVDLSDPFNPIYARLNGNVMMYAASLPKIAILLATEDALEKGEIEDTPELREKMRLMISKSNNAAATELMDMLGFEKIKSVLEDPKYDLYDEDYGGGLWVGKRYAKTGERHGDPLMGISHGATVTQVCRYYYLMAYGELISYDRSKEMLDLMADPELHHKFVANLEKIAPKATLYRKSGTWKNYHADSVLVWGPDRRYILVALIEDEDGEKICQNLALVTDKLLRSRSTVK
jgi:beta-lactamase class A